MRKELIKIFNDFISDMSQMVPRVIVAILVFTIFFFVARILYKSVGKRIQEKWKDSIVANFIAQSIKWVVYILGLTIALNIVGFGGIASSIIAGAGISAIVVGFAFRDIAENFLAGILLALHRPFEIGDIIEVSDFKGTVKDLDLRNTHLRSVEGKDYYIPNSILIKNPLTNYTIDKILRVTIDLGIAPETDVEFCRNLVLNYLLNNQEILQKPAPNVLIKNLGDYTVDIQVLFWVNIVALNNLPDEYLGHSVRSKIVHDLKNLLEENGVYMPSKTLELKNFSESEIRVKNIIDN